MIEIGDVTISRADLLAVAVMVPLVILLTTFVNRSRLGRRCAPRHRTRRLRAWWGSMSTTISLTFLLGGLLARAAGLIYALYQTQVWFFQGFTAGLINVHGLVMGGIEPPRRSSRGLIIGVIQQISDNRIGEWTPTVVFAYLVLIMVFQAARPPRRGDARAG